MKNRTMAFISIIFTNCIWGGSFLFSKLALKYTEPITLLALRFFVAFAALNIVLLIGKIKGKISINIKGKNLMDLFLLGLFQPVGYFICETYGIKLTTTSFSSIMIAMIPIVAIVFEVLFLKIYPTALQSIFAVISVGGVVIIALTNKSEGELSTAGIIYLIFAILSAVGYFAMSKKTSQNFSAFERTYFMFLMGFTVYMLIAIVINRNNLVQAIIMPFVNKEFLMAILYLGIVSSVIAFLCTNYSLSILSVSQTTVFSTLATFVAIISGVLFLNEPFGMIEITGSFMIILGLIGCNLFGKKY